jgi:hypothetical protein
MAHHSMHLKVDFTVFYEHIALRAIEFFLLPIIGRTCSTTSYANYYPTAYFVLLFICLQI